MGGMLLIINSRIREDTEDTKEIKLMKKMETILMNRKSWVEQWQRDTGWQPDLSISILAYALNKPITTLKDRHECLKNKLQINLSYKSYKTN